MQLGWNNTMTKTYVGVGIIRSYVNPLLGIKMIICV